MAGNPEKGSQPYQAARRRISQFYLKQTLVQTEEKNTLLWPHKPGNIAWIQKETQDTIGASIPSSLIQGLGLNRLSWKRVGENPISILLTGEKPPGNLTSVDQALATIEIAKRVDFNRTTVDKTVPLYLRIASATKDRIVAATYDLSDGNQLTHLTVSFSKRESDWINAGGNFPLESLPTDINNPYETAALITPAMCARVRHDQAINFQIVDNIVLLEKEILLSETDKKRALELRFHLSNVGCSMVKEERLVKIRVQPKIAQVIEILPWEINLPASLQPAPIQQL